MWIEFHLLIILKMDCGAHVELEKTKHMIGKREIGLMKKNAVLVNTARGPVVDEKALISALKENRIFSAGLDVFEEEPMIPDELIALKNVVLAPHIGSASLETRTAMSVMAAENLIDAYESRVPKAIVNPEVLEKKR